MRRIAAWVFKQPPTRSRSLSFALDGIVIACCSSTKASLTRRPYCATSVETTFEAKRIFTRVELYANEARGIADMSLCLSRWPQMNVHFPDRPIFPAVLTIHAMVHLAKLVEASLNPESNLVSFQHAPLSRIVRASFRHPVLPSYSTLRFAVDRVQTPQSSQPTFHGVATLPCVENCPIAAEVQFIFHS